MAKTSTPDPAESLEHKHEWHRPLGREFVRVMRKPTEKALKRSTHEWQALAACVMDFVIDVESGAKLWGGYERWNQRLFGQPLPVSGGEAGTGTTPARMRHFIWRMTAVLDPVLTLPPTHPDITALTDAAMKFWDKRKSAFKAKEHYSAFVSGPNAEGWVVKGKLIDLGETSYFFRAPLLEYARENYDEKENKNEAVINIIDDFLCNECTAWGGMGAVDLLAEVLEVDDERRKDLRAWRERHVAAYRIESIDKDRLTAVNLLGGAEYQVTIDEGVQSRFQRGTVLFGALIPWSGMWRWSGAPAILRLPTDRDPFDVDTLRQAMKRDMAPVVCRVWPEFREEVERLSAESYRRKQAFENGRDFVVYPTPQALADSMKRYEAETPDDRFFWMDDNMPLETGEVAVLHNPDGNSEMYYGYDLLKTALNKKGVGLTEDEENEISILGLSTHISPEFARRLLADHPLESVYAVFGAGTEMTPEAYLDWLLRCYKGQYFRTRFPMIRPEEPEGTAIHNA